MLGVTFNVTSHAQQISIVGTLGDGIQITSASDDGIEITDCTFGAYIVNPVFTGIIVTEAGGYGGYFSNDSTSSNSALYAGHGDNEKTDLFLDGDGFVGTNGDFRIFLDADRNGDDELFVVHPGINNFSGASMWVYETGDGGVAGTWSYSGGALKLDHPLDPENKYLYHAAVESPDMMNIYNGNIVLDENGEATIEMAVLFCRRVLSDATH